MFIENPLYTQFPEYHMKVLLREFSAVGYKVSINRLLGMTVRLKLIMLMELALQQ